MAAIVESIDGARTDLLDSKSHISHRYLLNIDPTRKCRVDVFETSIRGLVLTYTPLPPQVIRLSAAPSHRMELRCIDLALV